MPTITVLGAGVIGLTTALVLTRRGYPVHIVTADSSANTTSAVAGAMIGPVYDPDPRVAAWLAESDAIFRQLANDPTSGITIRRGRLIERRANTLPAGLMQVPGFALDDGMLPADWGIAYWVQVPIVDMPIYLTYLQNQLTAVGVTIEYRQVTSLAELASPSRPLVNCTGIGAAALTGDEHLIGVAGQHVIVDNPGIETFLYQGGSVGSTWVSWFPHGDRLVIGGSASVTNSRIPDPGLTERLLAQAAVIEPRLTGVRVRETVVGIRPRRQCPRIESQKLASATVIHHYGHGGDGVMLSWATAVAAADMVDQLTGRIRLHQ